MSIGLDEVTKRLRRHEALRQAGLPTLSALAGEADQAERLWREFHAGAGRATAATANTDSVAWLVSWLEAADAQTALALRAAAYAAAQLNEPLWSIQEALAGKTGNELELCLNRLIPPSLPEPARELSRLLLGGAGPESVAALARGLGAGRCFDAMGEILGEEAAPTLLVRRAPDAMTALRCAAGIVEEAPRLRLAVVVDGSAREELTHAAPDVRWRALALQGLIEVPTTDGMEAGPHRRTAVEAPIAGLGKALAVVERESAPLSDEDRATLADSAAEALTSTEADRARSAAERFLFQVLERAPQTQGLFRLNQTLEVRFGPRRLEIDLLCRQFGLAIELDGPHHFRDFTRYRRDRRKDLLMQRHGLLVLRFLSSDVVERLEEILAIVNEVILYKQRLPAMVRADEHKD